MVGDHEDSLSNTKHQMPSESLRGKALHQNVFPHQPIATQTPTPND